MLGDVDALQRESAAQRAQIAELIATNAKLVAEIAKLNDRVAELLAIAQRKQRKKTTPAEKTHAPPPVVGADAQQAFEARPMPPMLPEKKKTPKGSARRPGRNAIPGHLEAEEHRLRPTHCEHCGSESLASPTRSSKRSCTPSRSTSADASCAARRAAVGSA